ncbi:MAG TPA: phosphate ABC transporter ATP-binding protein [Thermoprotei archaeon]|nr:phosphate ABC transporter ATP-binding protein [Thermoprotei archaeon]
MDVKIEVIGLNVWYGELQALRNVNLRIPREKITAIIGPSGCGKSTLLKTLNRLVELIPGARVRGKVMLDGIDIYNSNIDPVEVRRKIGMVFQKPNPLPKSIFENVAFGLRIRGIKGNDLYRRVKRALEIVGLWNDVKERLGDSAFNLSVGQQQRLCIARAIVTEPEVLLMDEPCSSLDPITATKIEELITSLRSKYTVVVVTHNMQQAYRISNYTAFLYMGRLVEFGPTKQLFESPKEKLTKAYLSGIFG